MDGLSHFFLPPVVVRARDLLKEGYCVSYAAGSYTWNNESVY